jgi:hypothetical protein
MAGHQRIGYVESSRGGRCLVQDHLVVQVGNGIARVVGIAILHIENPVRRNAYGGSEHSTGRTCSSDGVLVYPVRTYGVGSGVHRHASDAKASVSSTEG